MFDCRGEESLAFCRSILKRIANPTRIVAWYPLSDSPGRYLLAVDQEYDSILNQPLGKNVIVLPATQAILS